MTTTHYPNYAYLAGYHEQTLSRLINDLIEENFVPRNKFQELETFIAQKIQNGIDAEKYFSLGYE